VKLFLLCCVSPQHYHWYVLAPPHSSWSIASLVRSCSSAFFLEYSELIWLSNVTDQVVAGGHFTAIPVYWRLMNYSVCKCSRLHLGSLMQVELANHVLGAYIIVPKYKQRGIINQSTDSYEMDGTMSQTPGSRLVCQHTDTRFKGIHFTYIMRTLRPLALKKLISYKINTKIDHSNCQWSELTSRISFKKLRS
jgi:hypothetical protein